MTPVTEAGKLLLGAIEDDLREQGSGPAERAAARRFAERIAAIEAEATAAERLRVAAAAGLEQERLAQYIAIGITAQRDSLGLTWKQAAALGHDIASRFAAREPKP